MPDLEINSSDGKGKVSTPDITSWIQTDRLVKGLSLKKSLDLLSD